MVTKRISKKISMYLKEILEDVDLRYAELCSGVPRTTIHRASVGQSRLQKRSAVKLAEFIEAETKGKVSAVSILNSKVPVKNFHGKDLRGTQFLVGEDLSDSDFSYADLRGVDLSGATLERAKMARAKMRDTNLSGVSGQKVDLSCTTMTGANLHNIQAKKWDFTGAILSNALIERVKFIDSKVTGTNFKDVKKWKNILWQMNGARTWGVKLPGQFDPSEMKKAFECHAAISALFLYEFPGDFQMLQLAECIGARIIPCWHGFAIRIQIHYPDRMGDIENLWKKYPDWELWSRWQLGIAKTQCNNPEDFEALKETALHKYYPDMINSWARKAVSDAGWIDHFRSRMAAIGSGIGPIPTRNNRTMH